MAAKGQPIRSRTSPRRFLIVVLAWISSLLLAGSTGRSQASGQPDCVSGNTESTNRATANDQHSVIRVNSSLIQVPVSVTDSSGQVVHDLELDDFWIEEEGVAQSVATMSEPRETPLELVLLYDVSASTQARFDFERHAASRFLNEFLRPIDVVTIVAIGSRPKLIGQRTIGNKAAIAELMRLKPHKSATAFYDSIIWGAQYLGKKAPPDARRVEIVLSDGEDNYSEHSKLADALLELQRTDCIFYSINPSGSSIRMNKISRKGHKAMEVLANQTGGAAFLPIDHADLDAIFARISAELEAQYRLGYYSTDHRTDGLFRRITVRIPSRQGLKVRARRGYYPTQKSHTAH